MNKMDDLQLTLDPDIWSGKTFPARSVPTKGMTSKPSSKKPRGLSKKSCPIYLSLRGGWHYSGVIMGNGFSVAWRVFDAQFWGVPQRRRRIALVADFGGFTAPEILFERKSVRGYTPPSGTPWKDFATAVAERFGNANSVRAHSESSKTYCIQGNCIDRADTAGCNGRGWTEGVSYTLNTVDRPAVYDARGNGDGQTVPTMTGDHNGHISDYTSLVCGFSLGFRAENTNLYEETATTICCDTRAGHCNGVIAIDRATFNQGENALWNPKITDDGINSTLTSKGPSAVCAAFSSRAGSKSGSIAYREEQSPTLRSSLLDTSVLKYCDSTVRRLTPLECERLQGFPDGWTDIGDYIDTNGQKRKTSDSARYRALGNSIALPSWVWVLERLSYCCGADRTMASLFDGIGGFPLIWETLNGAGTCLWASEIEGFPIAVTKLRFGED